jgi:HEAT repeats
MLTNRQYHPMTLLLFLIFIATCGLVHADGGASDSTRPVLDENKNGSDAIATQTNAVPITLLPTRKQPDKVGSQNVSYSKQRDGFSIQTRQATIPQILKAIAVQSGVVIHYSALPDTAISAHCDAKLFSQVLECLIGTKVNVAYRYPNQAGIKPQAKALAQSQPEEIWVLGIGRTDAQYATLACTLDSKANIPAETAKSQMPDAHSVLLQMSGLEDAQYSDLRKQAISLLAAQGKTGDSAKDDDTIAALHNAFKDKDPEIKTQAVFGLANQDMPERAQILEEAVSDQNLDVRLMAVDSANADNPADRAILQQALQDSDETIKAAASDKLGITYIDPVK